MPDELVADYLQEPSRGDLKVTRRIGEARISEAQLRVSFAEMATAKTKGRRAAQYSKLATIMSVSLPANSDIESFIARMAKRNTSQARANHGARIEMKILSRRKPKMHND